MLLQNFPVIFDLNEDDEIISISYYVFGMYERLPEKIRKDISFLDINIQFKVMSTLEILRQEGEIKGIIKGRIESVQKMHKNGFTVEQIIKVLDLDEKFVKEAIEKKK